VVVFSQDITERKKAEEALFEGQQVFRTLVENSPDIIARYDRECRRTYVNPTYLKVAQISRPELLATSPLQHSPLPVSSALVLQSLLRKVLDTGIAEAVDVIWPKSDNIDYWYNIYVSPEFDREGKVISVMSVSRDITERKKAEGEVRKLNQELEQRVAERTVKLEALNKELAAFAYSVSHDLRAPLRAIDGFSHILLEEYQDKIDAQGNNYLQRVRSAAQRMAQLIDDMLSLSRLTRVEMDVQPVNLSKMFREIAEDFHGTQPDRKVSFVIQEDVTAEVDARLLQIVFENLIENAWKFTSKHPKARIEFGVQKQKEVPVYFVRDDGAGFDMNYSQKIFGAFQRLHTTAEFPGTGIGLATVQRVIHRHGGRVWAEGVVEKGTTIFFTIP
jgi:PAS domain S-box-containing protein